jgi:hypothetical protein
VYILFIYSMYQSHLSSGKTYGSVVFQYLDTHPWSFHANLTDNWLHFRPYLPPIMGLAKDMYIALA